MTGHDKTVTASTTTTKDSGNRALLLIAIIRLGFEPECSASPTPTENAPNGRRATLRFQLFILAQGVWPFYIIGLRNTEEEEEETNNDNKEE